MDYAVLSPGDEEVSVSSVDASASAPEADVPDPQVSSSGVTPPPVVCCDGAEEAPLVLPPVVVTLLSGEVMDVVVAGPLVSHVLGSLREVKPLPPGSMYQLLSGARLLHYGDTVSEGGLTAVVRAHIGFSSDRKGSNIKLEDDGMTAVGKAAVALDIDPTPGYRFVAVIEFGTTGDDDQFIGVMPPSHNCGNFLTKKGCWSLSSNGEIWANGSKEDGTHSKFHGQSVTMELTWASGDNSILELTAPGPQLLGTDGRATPSVTRHFSGLPTESSPALSLWNNHAKIVSACVMPAPAGG